MAEATPIDLIDLVRPHIRSLKPYTSARDEFFGQAEVYLDANENPMGSLIEGSFNRYPDPHQRAVKQRLSELKGVSTDQIFLGNGSDEAIDLLMRAFCEPSKDHMLLVPPTYGMYQVSADINGIKTVAVPLKDDFSLPTGELIAAMRPGTKMVFLCSPNNPTGNTFQANSLRLILSKAPGLVIVDEAYIDFCPEKSVVPWLDEFPNLIVLQTFSKAWGLASLRLGMAFAHPEIIQILNRIKPPYNVNSLTQEKALETLAKVEEKNQMVTEIVTERERLKEALGQLSQVLMVYPSDANFLLVKVKNAPLYYRQLIDQKVIVRNRSNVTLCENCLRITVGLSHENQRLLSALSQL